MKQRISLLADLYQVCIQNTGKSSVLCKKVHAPKLTFARHIISPMRWVFWNIPTNCMLYIAKLYMAMRTLT